MQPKRKIAIFENEYTAIENAFRYVNSRYFDGQFSLENYPSSQSFRDLVKVADYDFIFVDIDLSSRSEMDGFSLLKEFESNKVNENKIIVLTGLNYDEVKSKLVSYKLKDYPIITKPISFEDLKKILSKRIGAKALF